MIRAAMAVATVTAPAQDRAAYARAARWTRIRAIVIDTILYGFISLVVNSVYGVAHIESFPQITLGAGTFTTAIAVPLQMVLGILYFLVPEAMFGATPGKWWVRLKVVRLDGHPLRFGDVVVRNVLRVVDYLPFFYLVGGFLVLATAGSQRLGDLTAGTTVVSEVFAREPGATRTSATLARRILAWSLAAALLFTIGFDYFGRPPLVIEGAFNQRMLIGNLDSYSLGNPTWGFGTVTYPLHGRSGNNTCSGTIQLRWQFLGWDESAAELECVPS